jgi:hypothetical protein
MRELGLKAGATALTLAAAAASAFYVAGHLRTGSAPLRPAVVSRTATQAASSGSQLSGSPLVKSGDVQPITSTYAS